MNSFLAARRPLLPRKAKFLGFATFCIAISFFGVAFRAASQESQGTFLSENASERSFQLEAGYADAVVRGDRAYLSGVVVIYRPGDTLQSSYERAFARIERTLHRIGFAWSDVAEITSFHTDLTTQMPAMVAVKHRFMTSSVPAWTAIGVTRLLPANGISEIKIVVERRPRPAG